MSYKRISPISVVEGGTGATTLTSKGVLVGNGTGAISGITAGTTGQLLTGVTSSNPAFASSSSGDFTFTTATAATTRLLSVTNTDNTSTSSLAGVHISTGGTSAGSPYTRYAIGTTRSYASGIDNSTTNDPWMLRTGANATTTTQSGTTLIQVEPTGEVLKPLNPCCLAVLNTEITNATGDGTFVSPVIFDTEEFDQNSNYDTSTGLFTAPVTGKYLISAQVTYGGVTASHTVSDLRISAGTVTYKSTFSPAAMITSESRATFSNTEIGRAHV